MPQWRPTQCLTPQCRTVHKNARDAPEQQDLRTASSGAMANLPPASHLPRACLAYALRLPRACWSLLPLPPLSSFAPPSWHSLHSLAPVHSLLPIASASLLLFACLAPALLQPRSCPALASLRPRFRLPGFRLSSLGPAPLYSDIVPTLRLLRSCLASDSLRPSYIIPTLLLPRACPSHLPPSCASLLPRSGLAPASRLHCSCLAPASRLPLVRLPPAPRACLAATRAPHSCFASAWSNQIDPGTTLPLSHNSNLTLAGAP